MEGGSCRDILDKKIKKPSKLDRLVKSPKLKDKFIGSLLGTFAGDALGMPVEGYTPEGIETKYGVLREMLPARSGRGTYTDDTEMMIGVAESIIGCKGFNGEDMAGRFLGNYHKDRGYGYGTMKVISLLKNGVSWDKTGEMVFAGGSYGNGSAMRAAPVGLFYFDNPDAVREAAYGSSRITHAHPLGKEGAAIQALAAALAVKRRPEDGIDAKGFLKELAGILNLETEEFRDKMSMIERLLERKPMRQEVIETLGHDSRVHQSVPASLYSFLSHIDSFEEAVVYAVGLGGDTDTIAAMTGAVAGAFHGKKGIPERWLKSMENGDKGRDYIEELGINLWKIKMGV